MQKKDQTFTKFCEFKALVEKGLASRLNLYGVIMVVSMSQVILRTSV